MSASIERLSPRERDCLRLYYDRHATSKEIAIALGIEENTASGYIRDAVRKLGAKNRREAALMLFGDTPRNNPGDQNRGLNDPQPRLASQEPSTGAPPAAGSWPDPRRSRNTLSPVQTLIAIVALTLASIIALALVIGTARGLGGVVYPLLTALDRLTH